MFLCLSTKLPFPEVRFTYASGFMCKYSVDTGLIQKKKQHTILIQKVAVHRLIELLYAFFFRIIHSDKLNICNL